MATRERRAAPRPAATEKTPASSERGATQVRAEKIREDMEALVEEIDEALEENAEEFVNNYRQRGGE